MSTKLDEIYDRIQTFEVTSARPSAKATDAGNNIQALLNIMAELVDEVRRIDKGSDIEPSDDTDNDWP